MSRWHLVVALLAACGSKTEREASSSGSAAAGSAAAGSAAAGSAALGSAATGSAAATSPLDAGATDAGARAGAPAAAAKVLQVVMAGRVGCARRADGRVRCWGQRWTGKRIPIVASPVEIPNLTTAVAIDVNLEGTLYVVTSDERVLAGSLSLAEQKELREVVQIAGAIDVRSTSDEVYVLTRAGDLMSMRSPEKPLLSDVVAISKAPALWPYALHRDGSVSIVPRAPKKVRDLTDAETLFGGRCAIRRGGEITCWDGDGRVAAWDGPRNIVERVRGSRFRCDLTASGVACTGANDVGQLGTGSGPDRADPILVDLPTKPIAITAGDRAACALLDAGDVACWGGNEGGQIGDGTLLDRPTPVVLANLTTPTPPPKSDGLAAVQQASVEMDWRGMSAGCTQPPKLVGPSGETLATVVSAYAHARKDGMRVWLADFRLEPGGYRDRFAPARGAQQAFELALWRGPNERKSLPIDRGRYRDQGPRRATLTIHDAYAASTYRDVDLVIEKVDKTWICGQLLDPDDPTKRQPFAARIHKPRWP